MSNKPKNIQQQFLIAEDDPSILRLVKTVIESEGYTAITTRDGREAIKMLFSGELFAGAIFDIKMPHIDGIELVKLMQTDNRSSKIPVIIMTAEQSLHLLSESYESGAVAFLPKPFTLPQLRRIVQTFVRKEQH